jgi:DNA-binding transcriptional MerR regulator
MAVATRSSAGRAASTLPNAQAVVASHRDQASAELFGITELCHEFGITLRALRFYEDKGLLSPRRINGARVYTRRDRARLALILRAKAIGSPLAEIKHYLDLYGDHRDGRVATKARAHRRDAGRTADHQRRMPAPARSAAAWRLNSGGARVVCDQTRSPAGRRSRCQVLSPR